LSAVDIVPPKKKKKKKKILMHPMGQPVLGSTLESCGIWITEHVFRFDESVVLQELDRHRRHCGMQAVPSWLDCGMVLECQKNPVWIITD
jgi:hypothetical protein